MQRKHERKEIVNVITSGYAIFLINCSIAHTKSRRRASDYQIELKYLYLWLACGYDRQQIATMMIIQEAENGNTKYFQKKRGEVDDEGEKKLN